VVWCGVVWCVAGRGRGRGASRGAGGGGGAGRGGSAFTTPGTGVAADEEWVDPGSSAMSADSTGDAWQTDESSADPSSGAGAEAWDDGGADFAAGDDMSINSDQPSAAAAAAGGGGGRDLSAVPCRFFNTPNGCSKGDNCPYLHDANAGAGAGAGAGSTAASSANAGGGGGGGGGGAEGSGVCKYWLRGACRKGRDCTYSHPPKDGATDSAAAGAGDRWQRGAALDAAAAADESESGAAYDEASGWEGAAPAAAHSASYQDDSEAAYAAEDAAYNAGAGAGAGAAPANPMGGGGIGKTFSLKQLRAQQQAAAVGGGAAPAPAPAPAAAGATTTIRVSGFPPGTKVGKLRYHFNQFGKVTSAYMEGGAVFVVFQNAKGRRFVCPAPASACAPPLTAIACACGVVRCGAVRCRR
jgi:hypothetical protein